MMSGNNAIFFYSLWQHLWGWLGGASIVLLLLSSIIVVKYYWRFTTIHIPRSIAWVGVRDDEIFSRVRAWIRELTAGLSTVHEGYAKASFLFLFLFSFFPLPPHSTLSLSYY